MRDFTNANQLRFELVLLGEELASPFGFLYESSTTAGSNIKLLNSGVKDCVTRQWIEKSSYPAVSFPVSRFQPLLAELMVNRKRSSFSINVKVNSLSFSLNAASELIRNIPPLLHDYLVKKQKQ